MITPQWNDLLQALEGLAFNERSYPYTYQDLPMLKLFVYARIKRISGFQTLQKHLALREDTVALLGLDRVPHRKTIATRFRSLPDVVTEVLTQLSNTYIETGDVDASIASVDSTLLRANGNVWHKKQREAGELPSCGNIDVEAHWGKSGCGEWIYGYRLHTLLFCGPDGVMWPTAVRVQAANIKDAHVFDNDLVQHLSSTTKVLLGDGGYDQQSCYDACDAREVTLLAPIKVKKTPLLKDANALCSTRTPKSARSSRYARQPSSRSKVISSVFSISNVSPVKDLLTSKRSVPSRFSPMSC